MPNPADFTDIAAKFVNLVMKKHRNLENLSPEGVESLFETVTAAGFAPKEVVPGKLSGDYLDQDGRKTGETYPINGFFPFKVIGEDGEDDYRATEWLNRLFGNAYLTGELTTEDAGLIIKMVAEEIEQRKPILGIILQSS
ncbi:hypothetical protein A2311_00240 [candidate division WOR-1 bacterium RIFOXYB2_FULL_48_7]|uniref:Uncharacterized protein n=1 Tax=candidate division WOR-1 bacterium RIFOXYB2_FULL_48_7 TaxID=1802583 RepID=A0A1F4TVA5_UNCSA|nr:MAG: hypothetical protein A2311_00240 [candidate division WOR-1 bacterium RIFOXYB2_FULL_48_7]